VFQGSTVSSTLVGCTGGVVGRRTRLQAFVPLLPPSAQSVTCDVSGFPAIAHARPTGAEPCMASRDGKGQACIGPGGGSLTDSADSEMRSTACNTGLRNEHRLLDARAHPHPTSSLSSQTVHVEGKLVSGVPCEGRSANKGHHEKSPPAEAAAVAPEHHARQRPGECHRGTQGSPNLRMLELEFERGDEVVEQPRACSERGGAGREEKHERLPLLEGGEGREEEKRDERELQLAEQTPCIAAILHPQQ
jgi:hypothetical protein